MTVKALARRAAVAAGTRLWGRQPALHRIPFGPLRGRSICTTFAISPRMWFGIDAPEVARWVAEHTAPDSVVYDIGAHVGYTPLLFLKQLGKTGTLHAFEIVPSTARCLAATLAASGHPRAHAHAIGLGRAEGTIDLPVSEFGMASMGYEQYTTQRERCAVTTLDAFAAMHEPPTIIKMDVEGAELDVLDGGRRTIMEQRPTILMEFHGPEIVERGPSVMRALGYRLHLGPRSAPGDIVWSSALCIPADR